jgi:hypothetical protein
MTSRELEVKLRAEIDEDIRIKEHPKLNGLSNIFWRTEEICPCPTFDVRENQESGYMFEFPWGTVAEHNSVNKITALLTEKIAYYKSDDYKELQEAERVEDVKVSFGENNLSLTPLNESNSTI